MSTFVYVQIFFLKGLALVYGIAFVIAYRQNKALIGDHGITPARRVLDQADLRAQYAKEEKRKSRLPKVLASSPWMYWFLIKLLEADPGVLQLLSKDPWNGQKPRWIRVEKYHYKFNHKNNTCTGDYWSREYRGRFYPRMGTGATLTNLWRQVDRQGG